MPDSLERCRVIVGHITEILFASFVFAIQWKIRGLPVEWRNLLYGQRGPRADRRLAAT